LVRFKSGNISEIVLNCCGNGGFEYEIFVGAPIAAVRQDVFHTAPYSASLPTIFATFAMLAAAIIPAWPEEQRCIAVLIVLLTLFSPQPMAE
jgi:hypothetical protein